MSTLFTVEAANLFCGDHDAKNSKHLAIQELKLPDLQEIYTDHHPGGSRLQSEIGVGIQKLEPTFKLTGFDPELLRQFGLGSRRRLIYTAYGQVVNLRTGESSELKAVIEARLGKVAKDAIQRGEVAATEYALNEVMHYEIHFASQELIYWDFFSSTWRVGGVDIDGEKNSILHIPRTN